MNSIMNGSTSHVPAFLVKLWRIVDDPKTNDLIGWSELGNSFIILNQSKFARELLPLYYKHNNMASFVRQLNMYGFHKVISVEQGGLRVEKEDMEFAHPFFLCGQESSLELIKRKISTAKIEESKSRPENYNKQVLMDVRQMKGRQETMDSKLINMKRENEALWRELAVLRQKHAKQQQIVSKLLQFLVSMMSNQSHRIGFKRRIPLMLADAEGGQSSPKRSRSNEEGLSPQGPVIHDVTEEEPITIHSMPGSVEPAAGEPDSSNLATDILTDAVALITDSDDRGGSGGGVEISDEGDEQPESILPDFFNEVEDDDEGEEQKGSNGEYFKDSAATSTPTPPTPTAAELLNIQYPTASTATPPEQQVGIPSSDMVVRQNTYGRQASRNDLDEHLGDMHNGLANLKDLLQGSQYNLDMDTLSGVGSNSLLNFTTFPSQLFGSSSDILGLSGELGMHNEEEGNQAGSGTTQGATTGLDASNASMVPYNPCLFELADDDSHFFDDSNTFLDEELESMLTTERSQLSDGSASGGIRN